MRTPHGVGPPHPDLVVSTPGGQALSHPKSPHRHTHIHESPTFPLGSVQPCLLRAWGTNQQQRRPRRAASLPGPPPEVRQHNRVPGTRTGRAAIWPGLFPVGFPLYRAPGWGQGHSPSSQPQKAWVSHEGDTERQVPRSQAPPLPVAGLSGSWVTVSREARAPGS